MHIYSVKIGQNGYMILFFFNKYFNSSLKEGSTAFVPTIIIGNSLFIWLLPNWFNIFISSSKFEVFKGLRQYHITLTSKSPFNWFSIIFWTSFFASFIPYKIFIPFLIFIPLVSMNLSVGNFSEVIIIASFVMGSP